MRNLEFKKCLHEQAVYTRKIQGNKLVVAVYIDDLLVTGSSTKEIEQFKLQMNKEFEMSNLGYLSFYLGLEVSQMGHVITLKQSAYARKLLKNSGMSNCNSCR